jgi:chromosomal replication initiation ATPase DnaA|tara:strand:- start:15863 stop:16159 length:297 start_codon:yes stop_codon:yes gene_type:complete
MKREIFDKYAHAIAKQFHLNLDEMFDKSRRRDLVDARQLLYYLCLERPIRVSYVQKFMEDNGCKIAHSTIIHGYKQAKALIDSDKDFEQMIDKINEEI